MPTVDGEEFPYTEQGKAAADKAKTKKKASLSGSDFGETIRGMHDKAYSKWSSDMMPQGAELPTLPEAPGAGRADMAERNEQLLQVVIALLSQDEQGQEIFEGTVYDDPVTRMLGAYSPARAPGAPPRLREPGLMHWPVE